MSDRARKPHYLVIGHPIGHSLSPLMHRRALQHYRMDADYLAVDLLPGDMDKFIAWINRDQFLGANITIPYKSEFLTVVDELDYSAETAGAMNTIVKSGDVVRGYNTDIAGFRQPLEQHRQRISGESAVVFGTGGASRAVVIALRELELEQIVMVSRRPEDRSSGDMIFCSYDNWQDFAEESVLVVNTTPLGMFPDVDSSPVKESEVHLLKQKICYDLVYNPADTRFLKQARRAGAEMIGGLEMFVGQGNRAFQLWTGREFPFQEIYKVLGSELK